MMQRTQLNEINLTQNESFYFAFDIPLPQNIMTNRAYVRKRIDKIMHNLKAELNCQHMSNITENVCLRYIDMVIRN